jgi:hypothetical protein
MKNNFKIDIYRLILGIGVVFFGISIAFYSYFAIYPPSQSWSQFIPTKASLNPLSATDKSKYIDLQSMQIMTQLQQKTGIFMGLIYTQDLDYNSLQKPLQTPQEYGYIDIEHLDKIHYPHNQLPLSKLLLQNQVQSTNITNRLDYPKLDIQTPIIYAEFADMFETINGETDFTRPIIETEVDLNSQQFLNKNICLRQYLYPNYTPFNTNLYTWTHYSQAF